MSNNFHTSTLAWIELARISLEMLQGATLDFSQCAIKNDVLSSEVFMFSSQSNFTPNTVFSLSSEVIRRKNTNGSVVVMSIVNEEQFYKVTGVAAEIFELLDGVTPIGEILTKATANYEVSEKQVYQDSEKFLQKLVELHLTNFK